MKPNQDVIQFMQDTLGRAGYEISEDPDTPGWIWENETAESEAPLSTQEDALLDAWESAAEYVRDIIGLNTPPDRWMTQWGAMSVGQQGKLILLCFEDDDTENALADGLFQAIRENDSLKTTLNTLGRTIERGNLEQAATDWLRAKHDHNLGASAL